ncbi:MAG: TIGR00730 family Rossman fold protein [Flavobacteriaceae bacterium]|nr:MAG: TIGR00730 family Rossman fold protein [Flavobacteriaceae bacterium]
MERVAVFCGSSLGFNEQYKLEAEKLGNYFCVQGIDMVYGGGKIGMMGAIADAMIKNNGTVIGVIPELLEDEEVMHDAVEEMIVAKSMSDRKVIISRLVDGYIAMPGGFGTLDELFEVLTLNQLGVEQKPVGLLNTNGFFDHSLAQLDVMVAEGFLKSINRSMLIVSDTVEGLLTQMVSYKKPEKTKIIDKVVR